MTIGSQKLIQVAVNYQSMLLRGALIRSGALSETEEVVWASPLEKDEFCEYRDSAALKRAGINDLDAQLSGVGCFVGIGAKERIERRFDAFDGCPHFSRSIAFRLR